MHCKIISRDSFIETSVRKKAQKQNKTKQNKNRNSQFP